MRRTVANCFSVALVLGLLASGAAAQTWSFDAGGSSVQLDAITSADDFDPPGPVLDLQTDSSFQTPFVDLMGGLFTIGENVSSNATDGLVISNAASVVKGNDGATLSIEWRAATDLEVLEDDSYFGAANAMLSSNLAAELSGLVPGAFYRVLYDWSYGAIAVEDHEAGGEDPESAATSLHFNFGGSAVNAFNAMAPPSGFDIDAGGGQFILLANAVPIDLTVNVTASADATMASPPILPGAPPEDGAGSEGFGSLRFRVERLIPEPASATLLALAMFFLPHRARRR